MSTTVPLRIDSDLVNQARSTGSLFDRPITAQIEHWAKLGRVLDAVLSGASVVQVKKTARVADIDRVVALSQTEGGRKKVRAVIAMHEGPVYEADPDTPGFVIERRSNGTTRRGRFANRQFVAVLK